MVESIIKSLGIFVLAGLCEIGGGYLVWLWAKQHKPLWYGIVGGGILAFYGLVVTWQPAGFGRVYATYVAFSLLRLYCGRGMSMDLSLIGMML